MARTLLYTKTIADNRASTSRWFRLAMVVWLLLAWAAPLLAQKPLNERERADFWASKGQNLMRVSQYAEAYTAFQLARSLGAPRMTAQMELAKKRNLNSIQFRALVAEARAQATTDPTQSLRLLEYARTKFPDSSSLLRAIGDIANLPGNWYYSLRADSIEVSSRYTYLIADTDKSRLYRRQGDTLTLIYTFSEKPLLRVFSHDERFLFVTMGKAKHGVVYALQDRTIKPFRPFNDTITAVHFSRLRRADTTEVPFSLKQSQHFRYNLLVEKQGNRTDLYNLFSPSVKPDLFIPAPLETCTFSPSGEYFVSQTGLWQFTRRRLRLLTHVEPVRNADFYVRFSDDNQHLLITNATATVGVEENGVMDVRMAFYKLGNFTPYTGDVGARLLLPRKLWSSFSPDGRYLLTSRYGNPGDSSLYYFADNHWQMVQPAQQQKPLQQTGNRSMRFSPNSRHLLSLDWQNSITQISRLWRLDGPQMHLMHEFSQKQAIKNDVFSPDGNYLLSPHTDSTSDQLWQLTGDSVRLVHTFKNPLRPPSVFDTDGWPMGTVYFSPDSRYLITYAATAESADSLWQLTQQGLVPVHGFKTRLKAGHTIFSPDTRWLRTVGAGLQPAMVWNIPMQLPLVSRDLPATSQALFSPKGNYLLTDKATWHVTDRQLQRFQKSPLFPSLANCLFSADDQYLLHAIPLNYEQAKPPATVLYTLKSGQLETIRQFTNDTLNYGPFLEGGITTETYQTGLFSPDGRQWLKGQSASVLPDTLWNLQSGGLSFSSRPAKRIDKQIINNANWGSIYQRGHVFPAALFSPDSRFLMTKEHNHLRFYQLKPTATAGVSVATQKGWPLAVSANATYWLTQTPYLPGWEFGPPHSLDSTSPYFPGRELIIPETPDTVKLWLRSETQFTQLTQFTNLYQGLNRYWQGYRRQSWFSATGNYLLVPNTKPALTTVYHLVGTRLQPVLTLNARLLTFAHIVPSPQDGWDVGLLYTDSGQQTYLLRHDTKGTHKIPLGFGILEYPPHFQDKLAYWVRKVDDSQQNLEILDLVSGSTLTQVPFGLVLDFTVRPNGDAWVVSTKGARLVRSPIATLHWLNQTPVAPLQPSLRQLYNFL